MSTSADPRIGPHLLRLGATSAAVAVGAGAVGAWPTASLAGGAGLVAMGVGLGVALAGAWIGIVPTLLWLRYPPQEYPTGIMAGLAARFGATAGLALAVWLPGRLAEQPLLLWVGLGHVLLLMVDVFGLTRLLRQDDGTGA